ncbi:MAG: endonuclease/exonuclease/phosphatase family protein [Bacteroidales bacterium]|nr:endonuclease/exonuclease/phosphatase family protein [Bacteroidales bacterium]
MKKLFYPILFSALLILIAQLVFGQANQNKLAGKTFRIAFYNVENLYDTIDDPLINDADFLPGARIPWTSERYEVKLSRLADVIHALSQPQPVAVMGLCEVENKMVLEDLVRSPRIIPYRFQVIHRDSPDERGIDNAMIYDPDQFQPLNVLSIPVTFPFQPEDRTRNILYVRGLSSKIKNDTLHIFVNHWPSRSEGKEMSEPKRIMAAETLKALTDSIFSRNPNALIVIMGDFNDEPVDKSITEGLKVRPSTEMPANKGLYNLMDPLYRQGKGTLYYKDWDLFDQVIISGSFWNKEKGVIFYDREGRIFEPEWLMFKTDDGTLRPNRTAAKEYYGGYSDHLPVYIDFILKK